MPLGTEQGTTPQDPQAVVPAPAEPVAPPTTQPAPSAGQGPWDQDLTATFTDEVVRSQVSEFLGQKVQPYVTQLEQSNKPALELYRDLNEKPKDTYLEVTEELYGKDVATAVAAYLNEVNQASPETQAPATPDAPQIDPKVQAVIDWKESLDQKAAYDAELARVGAANPGLEIDKILFDPVVAETGDFDQAVSVYRERFGPYLEYRAAQAAAAAAAPAEPSPPPNTLGTGPAAGQGEVQTTKPNQTLDEAIDEYFEQEAAKGSSGLPAPPVVTAG